VKRSYLIFVLILVTICGAILAYTFQSYQPDSNEDTNTNTIPAQNNSPVQGSPSVFSRENFSLFWGTVFLENLEDVRETLFVKFSVDAQGKTNITVGNITARVPIVRLRACDLDGKSLWMMEFPGYLWSYEERYHKNNGTAVPGVLITNTSEYLYVLVYQTAPHRVPEVRRYAPDDYLYIVGENGTVREFDLGWGVVPLRNAFLVSNGSYVLMGFERPQPDGSPYFGRVMILNGTEIIFKKAFPWKDPTCLCYVIPGWGKIDENGCATFGLYDGNATYCNGTLTFHREDANP